MPNERFSILREYRTRLIADVVTGKLDVRETAAQLPQESEDREETELMDDAQLPQEDHEENGGADADPVPEEAEP